METIKREPKKAQGLLTKKVSRRDFLKTTGVGAAGLTLSSWIPVPFTYGAEPPIKIGMFNEYSVFATEYGYWLGKVGRTAIAKMNAEGGIAGRKIELFDYDTKCKPAWAASMFKKMILEDKVDMIMGSIHSGVHKACFPLMKQYKIPFFSGGSMTYEFTGKDSLSLHGGYYIRNHSHARSQAVAAWKFGFDNLGKKWTFLVADYAWGHSLAREFGSRVRAAGGKTQEIRAPFATADFVPFLQKVDPDTEVLFTVFLGSASLAVLRQTVEMGLHKRLKRFTVICTTEGIGQKVVGQESEGAYYIEYHPRHLDQLPKELHPYEIPYRKACGVDEDGNEVGNPKVTIAGSHMFSMWIYPYMIKLGIEQTGWKDSKKNADLIKAICSLKLKPGPWCPLSGGIDMREEDHQGFSDFYISKVQPDLKLKVLKRIPKEDAMYEPETDLRGKL
jgi:branched-chain amino acid transport system substrate-binding protein